MKRKETGKREGKEGLERKETGKEEGKKWLERKETGKEEGKEKTESLYFALKLGIKDKRKEERRKFEDLTSKNLRWNMYNCTYIR